MKPIYIFFGTLAAAAAGIYYSFKAQNEIQAVQNWQLSFEGLSFGTISLTAVNLILKFRIINRAEVPLQIEKMRMEIFNKGAYIGLVETEKFTVRASGSDKVEIPVKLDSGTLVKSVYNMVKGIYAAGTKIDKKDYDLEFIGWADYKTQTFGNVVRYAFTNTLNLMDFISLPK